ncbi:MAG: hypothetical protein ABIL01_12170 [Pseudomonadota bacterium]
MGVHYNQEHGQSAPTYICQETMTRKGGKVCQSVPGKVVDPGDWCAVGRTDDADDAGGQPCVPGRDRSPIRRNRRLAPPGYRENALRGWPKC